jgi:hypothetical protein
LAERDHGAVRRRHQHFARDLLGVGAQFARVAHGDAEAFAPLHRGGQHFAAERAADHVLHGADR